MNPCALSTLLLTYFKSSFCACVMFFLSAASSMDLYVGLTWSCGIRLPRSVMVMSPSSDVSMMKSGTMACERPSVPSLSASPGLGLSLESASSASASESASTSSALRSLSCSFRRKRLKWFSTTSLASPSTKIRSRFLLSAASSILRCS